MSFVLTVTNAGRAAILNAAANGLTISLTSLAIGAASYAPQGTETALESQQASAPIAESSISPDGSQLNLSADFSGAGGYWVREVGVFAGATLVFLWSDPSAANFLAYKNVGVDLLLAVALALPNLPAGIIQVTDSGQALGLVLAPYDNAIGALAAEVSRLGLRDAQRLLRGQ